VLIEKCLSSRPFFTGAIAVAIVASATTAAVAAGSPGCAPTDPACQNTDPGGGNGNGNPPAPPPPLPSDFAPEARAAIQVNPPAIRTKPTSPSYVNIVTSFWIAGGAQTAWQKFEGTAGPPREQVIATAQPFSLYWDFGDGTSKTCYDPGDSTTSSCSIDDYSRSSAHLAAGKYPVTATMTWHVTWICEGPDCQGQGQTPQPLPDIIMSGNAALEVDEVQNGTS
jgi:hypothetical protein